MNLLLIDIHLYSGMRPSVHIKFVETTMVEVTSWVEDVEKMLLEDHEPSSEVEQWRKHSIYRVPARIKRLNGGAYKPQMVSLGPFHHGDPDLVPMEKHKRRALLRLVRRAGRPFRDLVAAVREVEEQLRMAYVGLGDEWRGGGGDCFVEMMVDGRGRVLPSGGDEDGGSRRPEAYGPSGLRA